MNDSLQSSGRHHPRHHPDTHTPAFSADADAVRTQLLAQREALCERLARVERDVVRAYSADSAEQAQERENDEVVDQIGNETRCAIQRIDRALARLGEGQYGICASCGEPIGRARLAAMPDASDCVKCAK